MASPKTKATHEGRYRTSCLASCFGRLPEPKARVPPKTRATGGRRPSRWWCWTSRAKGSRRKTVPVDMDVLQDVSEEQTSHIDKVMDDRRPTDDKRGKKVNQQASASTSTPKTTYRTVSTLPKLEPTRKTAGNQPGLPTSEPALSAKSSRRHLLSSGRPESRKRWHPTLKMSILVVALGITLIWGRLCGILPWSYFLPRLCGTLP